MGKGRQVVGSSTAAEPAGLPVFFFVCSNENISTAVLISPKTDKSPFRNDQSKQTYYLINKRLFDRIDYLTLKGETTAGNSYSSTAHQLQTHTSSRQALNPAVREFLLIATAILCFRRYPFPFAG